MYKLIRDNIPEIAAKAGTSIDYAVVATDDFYKKLLFKKLREEVDELELAAKSEPESSEESMSDFKAELGDVLDVIMTLAEVYHVDDTNLQCSRKDKAERNGLFKKKLIGFFEDKKC